MIIFACVFYLDEGSRHLGRPNYFFPLQTGQSHPFLPLLLGNIIACAIV
jgi:hypothetical protein